MPEHFQTLINATRIISGYNVTNKTFRAPSLALHMSTNIKVICDIALKIIIEKRTDILQIEIKDRGKRKQDIKDFKKLIEGHWNAKISSLALKNLKENY